MKWSLVHWTAAQSKLNIIFVCSGIRVVCKAQDVRALSPFYRYDDDYHEDCGEDDGQGDRDDEEDDAYEGAGALVSCFSKRVLTPPD